MEGLGDLADFDSEPDVESDDDIVVICNVHDPSQKAQPAMMTIPLRPRAIRGFKATNPVWLTSVRSHYVPVDLSSAAEKAKPWREMESRRNEFFNYGFTDYVWDAYKFKQQELKGVFTAKSQSSSRRSKEPRKSRR